MLKFVFYFVYNICVIFPFVSGRKHRQVDWSGGESDGEDEAAGAVCCRQGKDCHCFCRKVPGDNQGREAEYQDWQETEGGQISTRYSLMIYYLLKTIFFQNETSYFSMSFET